MDGGGAVDMCVHGTMGAVTALIETGRLEVRRDGVLRVDTPESVVEVKVRRSGKSVTAVELQGVPSRAVATSLSATVRGRPINYDLAFGGNLIAIVRGADIGVKVDAKHFRELVEAGMELKTSAQRAWKASRSRLGPWPEVVSSLMYTRLAKGRYRDLVVFRDHSVDRSPCGSCCRH